MNPAKQGRKAAFNRAGDAAQRSRWTFYEAITNYLLMLDILVRFQDMFIVAITFDRPILNCYIKKINFM
ncbi:MAG: hypothetical protein A2V65_00725 [Deltaproteobacteria bacterium RBG_13_49_15]|nr:MAG: hypothetical protein A2V65_00725 [Deltaproteobacteria bacterium RBG_13_49_15]